MKKINIAIDGPASSGKSTIAKILAKNHRFIYIDTGAMYRAVTYLAIQNKLLFTDERRLLALLKKHVISMKATDNGQLVFIDRTDVTGVIRENEVTNNVSTVASLEGIRKHLVFLQQQMALSGGVVMDGRDIGTVVLPEAEVKIFLVASVKERAMRRFKENKERGIPCDLEQLQVAIQKRDHLDSTREISPLTQASDAILVDTTGFGIEEVVEKIEEIIEKKKNK